MQDWGLSCYKYQNKREEISSHHSAVANKHRAWKAQVNEWVCQAQNTFLVQMQQVGIRRMKQEGCTKGRLTACQGTPGYFPGDQDRGQS